jgi:hypothetical protein
MLVANPLCWYSRDAAHILYLEMLLLTTTKLVNIFVLPNPVQDSKVRYLINLSIGLSSYFKWLQNQCDWCLLKEDMDNI